MACWMIMERLGITLLVFSFIINYAFPWRVYPVNIPPLEARGYNNSLHHQVCKENFAEREVVCSHMGFSAVPENIFQDVRVLDMSHNLIEIILPYSFQRYKWLVYLNISHNRINYIDPAAFYSLNLLAGLNLAFNHNLTHFPVDALKWLPALQTLDLAFNGLNVIHLTACGTIHMAALYLSGNPITEISNESFTLDCPTNLLALDNTSLQLIESSALSTLPVETLQMVGTRISLNVWTDIFISLAESRTIKKLFLSKAGLFEIPPNFFHPLRGYSFSILDISGNNMTPYHFIYSDLTFVQELDLSGNRIWDLEPEYFEGMAGLRILRLEYSGLEIINPNVSFWKIDLTELYLAGNMIVLLEPNVFNGLHNLRLLDLRDNTYLIVAGIALWNLESLDISKTCLQVLRLDSPAFLNFTLVERLCTLTVVLKPGYTFEYTPTLRAINLEASELKPEALWDPSQNVSLFKGLKNLTTVVLDNNPLGHIPSGIFLETHSLRTLYLRHCDISFIDSESFKGLHLLENLFAENNSILFLRYDSFTHVPNLVRLTLNNNSLEYLEAGLFSSMLSLTKLILANNKLVGFNQSTLNNGTGSSVSTLDISGNPLVCNCKLGWLVKWIKISVSIVNSEKTVCTQLSLQPLRGKSLMTFDPDVLCGSDSILVSSILLGVSVASSCLILVYLNRWHIRYKLFLLKLTVLTHGQERDEQDRDDFDFDINVMFSDDDEQWARQNFRPLLEERLPQFHRNTFGDDDLVLGMHYLDAVHFNVERSFKMMLLVSCAAVRNNWFLMKFRTAMDRTIEAGRLDSMVVIFLDDIPDGDLPFVVRLYLSERRPYLSWRRDEIGQEYFWNELFRTLQL